MTNKKIIGAVATGMAGVAAIGLSICMGLNTKKYSTQTISVEDDEVIDEEVDEVIDEVIDEVE